MNSPWRNNQAEPIRWEKTLPYHERIRRYEAEKPIALQICNSQEEVQDVLYRLRKRWGI